MNDLLPMAGPATGNQNGTTARLPSPSFRFCDSKPLSCAIDPARRRVWVTYHAQPTFDEWTQAMEEIFAAPAYQAGFGILLDRRVVSDPAETGFIKQAVAFMDRHAVEVGPFRCAILVSNLAAYGMARMASLITDTENSFGAFWSERDAEVWLAGGKGAE